MHTGGKARGYRSHGALLLALLLADGQHEDPWLSPLVHLLVQHSRLERGKVLQELMLLLASREPAILSQDEVPALPCSGT